MEKGKKQRRKYNTLTPVFHRVRYHHHWNICSMNKIHKQPVFYISRSDFINNHKESDKVNNLAKEIVLLLNRYRENGQIYFWMYLQAKKKKWKNKWKKPNMEWKFKNEKISKHCSECYFLFIWILDTTEIKL